MASEGQVDLHGLMARESALLELRQPVETSAALLSIVGGHIVLDREA